MKQLNTPEKIAERILSIRSGLNLGQAAFASKIGICKRTLQRYEHAERVPDIITWGKIEALVKGIA